jgi:glutaredoxin 3
MTDTKKNDIKGMPQLILYHFVDCPYCQRVMDFLSKEGITVPMKDTHEDPAYNDELIKIGGKPQVPCLVIDGKALYESLDIIEWFKKNIKNDH